MAVINGTSSADTLSDTTGDDTINGFGGNDTINGGSGGTDVVDGGDGRDSLMFMTATTALVVDFVAGTVGSTSFTNIERVVTGDFNDQLTGNSAAQNLTARAGMDTLWGAGGFDTLWGGSGADTFIFREFGAANADNIGDWTSGSDKLVLDATVFTALGDGFGFVANSSGTAQTASDRIIFETDTRQVWYDADGTGAGARQLIANLQVGATLVATDIVVEGGGGPAPIVGTEGDDSLTGTDGDDTIDGLGGNDTLQGLAGADLLSGGSGNDELRHYSNSAVDTLDGGAGDDVYDLRSSPFSDPSAVLIDAGGVDTILSNHDLVLPDGFENLELHEGRDGTGNALDNVIITFTNESGSYVVDGGDGDDTLLGGEDLDFFLFNAGSGAYGNDVVDGGADGDWLDFSGARSAIVVDMRAGTVSGGGTAGAGTVSFTNVEQIRGSAFADQVIAHDGAVWVAPGGGEDVFFGAVVEGGDGNDTLTGGAATDSFSGDAGDDVLSGRGGRDVLGGDGGADTFVFDVAPGEANADTIADYVWGSGDTIRLDATVMPALGATGRFSFVDARFAANSTGTAQDASDRVIYNTSSGELWYDGDGNGSGAALLIATLQGAPLLRANGIEVVNGVDPINGTPGNDSLTGTDGDDTMNGFDGDDTLDARAGHDSLVGGAGADSMVGGDGNDILNGNHFVMEEGEAEVDTMDGGAGDDLYRVDNPNDVLSDSGGLDTVHATEVNWTLGAGFEDLVIANDFSESGVHAVGNELDNRISITYAGSTLEGRGGNDTLIGGVAQNGNELFGGDGDDSLVGGGQDDLFDGGAGRDTLNGFGSDAYYFSVAPGAANADLILGFDSGLDLIRLDGAVHASAGMSGSFSPGDARFASGAGFTSGQDANDRVIYDTATGRLFYDADGNGAAAAQLIATLQGVPDLQAGDIVIVNGDAEGLALTGTAGADSLVGSSGRDTINGLAGNDTIHGGGGRDLLVGGDGNDHIVRDDGTDRFPEDFQDTLDGGLGDDTYDVHTHRIPHSADPNAVILDAGGVDTVLATNWTLGPGIENLTLVYREHAGGVVGTGNELDNLMRTDDSPGAGTQSLLGQDGNDTLIGHAGTDGLLGGAGNDWLDAGIDAVDVFERLIGGAGNDSFVFHAPPTGSGDHINDFASSADQLVLDGAGFTAIGGSGQFSAGDARFAANSTGTAQDASDRVIYNTSTGEVWYDADGNGAGAGVWFAILEGAPALAAADIVVVNGSAAGNVINGTSGHDTLTDTTGNDTINGLAGNDSINGGHGGTDVVNGGDGRDSLLFMTATGAVVFDFVAGTAGNTTFTSIERAVTGDFNDTLTGNAAAQNLTARSGSDTLWGAGGIDTLWGGAGADTFIFRENGSANADTIGDWTSGSDEIALDNAVMAALGADGAFVAGDARFWASSTGAAHDATDRVLYNTTTRSLYYDADGNGAGAALLIATVQSGATIAATDIAVI